MKIYKNIDYSLCLNSGPGVYTLSKYYQEKTNNLKNNIKNIFRNKAKKPDIYI